MDTPIERAVRLAGNQSKLAGILGVTPQAVQQWVERNKVPADRCVAIENAVEGQVTRYELNPGVFGQQPKTDDSRRHTPGRRATDKKEAA